MLSPMAALLATWAAIYGLIGLYYGMLFARRPKQPEYRAYGLTCLGFALWAGGAVLAVDAPDSAALLEALRLRYAGGFISCGFFVEFAARLTGEPRPRWLAGSFAVCAAGLLLDATGLLLETTAGGEAALTTQGALTAGVAIAFSMRAVWQIARGPRDLRPLIYTSGLAVLAATSDVFTQLSGRSLHLLEHVALVPVITVSAILQRRFLEAARALSSRTEELRRSYSDLREIQEALVRQDQLAAVGELSAVIAHEVRNPLAIIKNAISSLRRPSIRDADRRVLLGILDEEVDRLGRLVKNLLAYARPVTPRERPVELEPVVSAAIDAALGHHDAPASITVELELDDLRPVPADPDLLQQALSNVVANALQAMPQGGRLLVRGRETEEPSQTVLEFVDDGAGMESLVRAKARDPFFTTRASGTGLGLAIVERVVRNHGGTLELESAEGDGTTVRVALPRDEEPAP